MKTNAVEISVLFVLIQVLTMQTLQSVRQYVTVSGITRTGDPITLFVHQMNGMGCVLPLFVIKVTKT
jgi:hypothetical protein